MHLRTIVLPLVVGAIALSHSAAAECSSFDFKGLGADTDVGTLEEAGLVICKDMVANGRTALCAAEDAFFESKYGTFVGLKVRFILIHALDGKIVRLFIQPDSYRIEEKLPTIVAALTRKFGEPTINFDRGVGEYKTEYWDTTGRELSDGSIFYPKLWRRGNEQALLGVTLASFLETMADDVFHRYGYQATNDTLNRMHGSFSLLIVSDKYVEAKRIYFSEVEAARNKRKEAIRASDADDI